MSSLAAELTGSAAPLTPAHSPGLGFFDWTEL